MVVSEHSINAKLLYPLLLNRTMLSQKSGWVSEDGNVYVIYTSKQMANDLKRSERTVKTALCELENAGLLTRVRQGLTKANKMCIRDRSYIAGCPYLDLVDVYVDNGRTGTVFDLSLIHIWSSYSRSLSF